ncbi:MAG: VOC family protein [Candidatus Levybacteria bacterium]|nr:VOC family protein [Candidatus Levybacteria bacterium]
MQKISGFGGYFFRAKDPEGLSKWYEKNFGINAMNSTEIWMQQAGPTVFAPFPQDTDYFASPLQQAMVNFRVNDLDAMLEQLKTNGVRIDEERIEDSVGKFASVYDPEGNKIELWEPTDASHWKDTSHEKIKDLGDKI